MSVRSKVQAHLVFALLGALGALFFSPASAEKVQHVAAVKPPPGGERRVALVIGNSAYKVSPLRNPVRDARAMAKILAEAGFSVALIEDSSQAGMRRAIRSFGDELTRGGTGLFYFAGHGLQVQGRNYLIPVNADIEREDEIEDQAVDANLVLSKMDSAKNSVNIMILDACRNNPYRRSFRSVQQGLAQMDAPAGTLISFATAPGSVAFDGDGENGLYTKHLLAAIRQPGLSIEQLFKQVRIGVSKETREKQIPWESSSLTRDFYFYPPDLAMAAAAQRQAIDKAVSEAVKVEQEKAARERATMQAEVNKLLVQLFAKQEAEMKEEIRRRTGAAGSPVVPPVASIATNVPSAEALTEAQSTKAEVDARQRAEREAKERKALEAKVSIQVAAVKPTASVAPSNTGLPRAGDQWIYRTTDLSDQRTDEVVVKVKGTNENGIIEEVSGSLEADQWAWSSGARIRGRNNVAVLSPYLFTFDKPAFGHKWNSIAYQRYCTHVQAIDCHFEGRYVGREEVTVAAGTFDAHKVEVYETESGNRLTNRRILTYWYADEVKRHIKITRRAFTSWDWLTNIDMELLSYKIQ